MNRDREALIEAMKSSLYLVGRAGLGSGHYAAIAGHEKAADAILALPVGGGVEEDEGVQLLLADLRKGRDRRAVGDPVRTEFEYHIDTVLRLAALSPTTLGGRSGSAQDGLPPARSLPSTLTSAIE